MVDPMSACEDQIFYDQLYPFPCVSLCHFVHRQLFSHERRAQVTHLPGHHNCWSPQWLLACLWCHPHTSIHRAMAQSTGCCRCHHATPSWLRVQPAWHCGADVSGTPGRRWWRCSKASPEGAQLLLVLPTHHCLLLPPSSGAYGTALLPCCQPRRRVTRSGPLRPHWSA